MQREPVFSLGCFWGGVLYPPVVQIYPPISVSEAVTPPIIKNDDMQSLFVFNNYYRTGIHMQVHSIGMQYSGFKEPNSVT